MKKFIFNLIIIYSQLMLPVTINFRPIIAPDIIHDTRLNFNIDIENDFTIGEALSLIPTGIQDLSVGYLIMARVTQLSGYSSGFIIYIANKNWDEESLIAKITELYQDTYPDHEIKPILCENIIISPVITFEDDQNSANTIFGAINTILTQIFSEISLVL